MRMVNDGGGMRGGRKTYVTCFTRRGLCSETQEKEPNAASKTHLRQPDDMILSLPNGVAAALVRFHPATLRANPTRSHAA
jgi:hypothetical protein